VSGRSLGTTRERAVRARGDDRNRRRSEHKTGSRGRTSLDRPERVRADPSPTGTSIRACGTVTGRRAADVLATQSRAARYRRPAERRHGRPQPAAGPPSSPARRPDRLAFYMGYCPHRRTGHERCGTRDGRTLPRRTRLGRHAWSSSRAGVWRALSQTLACRPKTRRATGREPGAGIVCLSGSGDRVPCGIRLRGRRTFNRRVASGDCSGAVGPCRRASPRRRRHRRLRADEVARDTGARVRTAVVAGRVRSRPGSLMAPPSRPVVGDLAHGGGEGRCPPLLAARHRHPPAADDVERAVRCMSTPIATDGVPRASWSEATIMRGYSRRPARLTPDREQGWFRGPGGGVGARAAAAQRRSERAVGARSASGECAGRSAAGRV
jgi:hypothetical protein